MFHHLQVLWHKLFSSLVARINTFKKTLGETTTLPHNMTEVTRHCNEQDKQHSLIKQSTLKPQISMIYLKISSMTFCRKWVPLQEKKVLEKDEHTHTHTKPMLETAQNRKTSENDGFLGQFTRLVKIIHPEPTGSIQWVPRYLSSPPRV